MNQSQVIISELINIKFRGVVPDESAKILTGFQAGDRVMAPHLGKMESGEVLRVTNEQGFLSLVVSFDGVDRNVEVDPKDAVLEASLNNLGAIPNTGADPKRRKKKKVTPTGRYPK